MAMMIMIAIEIQIERKFKISSYTNYNDVVDTQYTASKDVTEKYL